MSVVTNIYVNINQQVMAFQLGNQQWYEIQAGPNYSTMAGMILLSKSTSKLSPDQWQMINFDGTSGQGVVGLLVTDLYLT